MVSLTCLLPSAGPASSSASLLSKTLSLEPSCSPCGLQGGLDADNPQLLSSNMAPSAVEEGAELVECCGPVMDTGPAELPVTTVTPPTKIRPPLPGPKPQGTTSSVLFFDSFSSWSHNSCNL